MTINEKNSGNLTPSQMFELGHCYYNGQNSFPQDKVEAFKWYRAVAKQGHADAQNILKNNNIEW